MPGWKSSFLCIQYSSQLRDSSTIEGMRAICSTGSGSCSPLISCFGFSSRCFFSPRFSFLYSISFLETSVLSTSLRIHSEVKFLAASIKVQVSSSIFSLVCFICRVRLLILSLLSSGVPEPASIFFCPPSGLLPVTFTSLKITSFCITSFLRKKVMSSKVRRWGLWVGLWIGGRIEARIGTWLET